MRLEIFTAAIRARKRIVAKMKRIIREGGVIRRKGEVGLVGGREQRVFGWCVKSSVSADVVKIAAIIGGFISRRWLG